MATVQNLTSKKVEVDLIMKIGNELKAYEIKCTKNESKK